MQECGSDTETLASAYGTPVRVPPVRAVRSRVASANAAPLAWRRALSKPGEA
jgi:hypothetical protein